MSVRFLPPLHRAGFRRFGVEITLCLVITLLAVVAAAADERPVRLELNRLEPQGEACRTYLLIENPSDAPYRSLKLDLFAFDTDGVIAKRVALEVGPVPARKTNVKLFDFQGLACDRFSRVLLNDVIACEGAEGPKQDCLTSLRTGSKVTRVDFTK